MDKRKKWLIRILGLLLAVVVVFYAGVYVMVTGSFTASEVITENVSAEQLAACGRVMKVTFPPSTQPLGMRSVSGWLDDELLLKIQMNVNELQAFLDASPFAGRELGREEIRIAELPELPWWDFRGLAEYEGNPEQRAFSSDQVDLPNAEVMRILVDMRQDVVTVYLEWFQT